MKVKKVITITTNSFQKILNKSGRKPSKIWVDQGSGFCNKSMKSWLHDNEIEMYSTHNKGKSVVTERFIKNSKYKIYKHMIAVSKNVYINKLDEIVDKYNKTDYRAIKMKPADVKSGTYINYGVEYNEKNLKSKVGYHVRMSKYKNIFVERHTPNWSEKVFVIKKIKNTVAWTYVISNLNDKEIVRKFCEKELQKTN